jgi:2-dehydro-3-deoxy-D-arabinonate dehydratase
MTIKAKIIRGTNIAWEAETSLGSLNRTLEDLITYLFRCQDFPHGVILSTGTGIVPPLDISLEANDIVEIDVAGIGKLTNTVEVIQERR